MYNRLGLKYELHKRRSPSFHHYGEMKESVFYLLEGIWKLLWNNFLYRMASAQLCYAGKNMDLGYEVFE